MLNKLKLTVGLLLLVSVSMRTAAQDWLPFPMDSESLDVILEDVDRNGPRLIKQEFTPYRVEGLLQQCGYYFATLMKDWAYRSDQPIIVDGSLLYQNFPGKVPSLVLRLGVSDIEMRNGSFWQKKVPPNYAYIRYEKLSSAGQEFAIGMRNFVYIETETELDPVALLLGRGSLTVGFNRESGGSDLEFEIPISGSEIYVDVAGCITEMITTGIQKAN